MLKRSFVIGAIAFSVGMILSCGGDDDVPPTKLAEPCHANSDCGGDLICALGKCHSLCANSKDCPAGQRCVKTDTSTACQLPAESKCTFNSDCESPLVCGIDRSCRNQCQADRDCLSGQFCDVSQTCADRSEVPDGGGLPDLGGPKPDGGSGGSAGAGGAGGSAGTGGAAGTGGTAGTGGAGGSGGAAGAGTGGSTVDAGPDVSTDVSMDRSMDTSSMDISTNPDSIRVDAGCGHAGEACCATGAACVLGATCDPNMMCIACGQKDQACCSGASACLVSNLDCISGTCQCGAQSQVCCGGTTCSAGLTCSGVDGGKPTCGCGGNNQACCANSMCSSSSLNCAGAKCTCITACFSSRSSSETHILRSDGTAWYYAGYSSMPVVVSDASMVPITGFTKVTTGDTFSCGLKADKTAWCWWNTAPGGATASYGQLGDGTTNASRSPVQVVTSVSGPGLANVVDIATYSNTTCAVTGDGGVQCWGYGAYGQLGIGTKPTYSAYATPVLTAIGGPAFTGADQVGLGSYHSCAHKADNTIWCWGYNNYGQVGDGTTTEALLPVYVSALSNQANQLAVAGYESCARSGDTAWCWGYNGSGLGDGVKTTSSLPVQVLAAAGGAVFTGISDLRAGSSGACALKAADKSVWCWGGFTPAATTPVPASPAGFAVSSVYYWDTTASSLCFARTDGELYLTSGKVTYPVACP